MSNVMTFYVDACTLEFSFIHGQSVLRLCQDKKTLVINNLLCILCRYFDWVTDVKEFFRHWIIKFSQAEINYDDIIFFEKYLDVLISLEKKVCISCLLMEQVRKTKTTFLEIFDALNALLLLYIPGQTDGRWCSLPALLEDYGVSLPHEAQELISNKVIFPGQKGQHHLGTPLQPSSNGKFHPGQDISLTLHKEVILKELSILINLLQPFLKPLEQGYMSMLIIIKFKKSVLFEKYLRHHFKKSPRQMPLTGYTQFPESFSSSHFAPPSAKDDSLPMRDLVNALESTHSLIDKIMLGTATYSEIIAEDEQILEQMDIDKECAILKNYYQQSKFSSSSDDYEGLKGVQSMLELFQYATHINNISIVCNQYHLENCISDPLLEELVEIKENYLKEENRSKLTPIIAIKKMKRIKDILCLGEKTSSKCLDIFAAMTSSVPFYQFLKEKQFYGQQGQDSFLQQYELITAQLQHEEYKEQVLNHLFVAFKAISIFMDASKCFSQLMRGVTGLNVTDFNQLVTVNDNINLVQFWFSRAEVNYYTSYHHFTYIIYITGRYSRKCC